MRILKHGNIVKFTCPVCGCVFTELADKSYSSMGSDGAHYCETCPDCLQICWTSDNEQKKEKES